MSRVTANQPLGTPTWIALPVPDVEAAKRFYAAVFGWTFDRVGPYTTCLLDGWVVGALVGGDPDGSGDPGGSGGSGGSGEGPAERFWDVYLATDDCDDTAARIEAAGGTVLTAPTDVMTLARVAVARDPVGARFGLWQGRSLPGCQVVNEPNSLVRSDVVTADAEPARKFYSSVFGFTLDRNEDVPELDFTFLRRPDGHEVAGVFGLAIAQSSQWSTTFEVADTDDVLARAKAAGGAAGEPNDMPYGRYAMITDPFGTEFSVIARAQPLD